MPPGPADRRVATPARGSRDRRSHRLRAVPERAEVEFERPVKIFAADPALLTAVDPPAARVLRDRAVVDSAVHATGIWRPPSREDLGPGALGLLVLEGLLSRTLRFGDHASPELVGVGDLLRPWEDDDPASLEFHTEWRVLEQATVALLDDRFARATRRVPGLVDALLERATQRARWLSFQLAIAHVRRAEPRVMMLLWHLADRWGRVTPAGTVVPVRLTHTAISRLVCMRRPTISTALIRLQRAGELVRNDDGTWTITGAPPDLSALACARLGEEPQAA